MGRLVLEAGRYNQFEEFPIISFTTTSMTYMFGMMDNTMQQAVFRKMTSGIGDLIPDSAYNAYFKNGFQHPKIYNAPAILSFVDSLEQNLGHIHLSIPDSTLVLDEYKNAFRMIRLGALAKQYNLYHPEQADSVSKKQLTEMTMLCQAILREHQRLWMIRNKKSGLEQSMDNIRKLQTQVNQQLELLDKNFLNRWLNRTGEKLMAGAAVLYLRS
jgi:hypothetical protein